MARYLLSNTGHQPIEAAAVNPSPDLAPVPEIPPDLPPEQRIPLRLAYLYGAAAAAGIERRIERLVATHRQLRERATPGVGWSHRDLVLITYGDSIQSSLQPPLQTLHGFLERHLEHLVSMVHILPFFPWSSDDGFSVTDFRAVKQDLGDWQDIGALAENFELAFDLVLNHCSRENLWFLDYLAGQEPACHYFIEVDPATNLSMVTRPRTSPLLSGARTPTGLRHVWTTFSNDQVDMNYANPDVLIEFIDILLYYIRRGARMLRLDAVAYLWKQIGTPCIHLPQTHQVIKLFRDILEQVEPAVWIMTETNVPHAENISYFGAGDEANLVYQFSLPPLLLHGLDAGTSRYLNQWARGLEALELPPGCTFLNFTASHDGVGLRPLEGLVPRDEVDHFLDRMRKRGGYISSKSNTDGSVSPYELNISYFDAFRDIDGDDRWHLRRFLLSQILALSFKGIPAIYIHSLTATPNDIQGVERTGMTRSINRRKWDLGELEYLIGNPDTPTGQVFAHYRELLLRRRKQPAFHPDAHQQLLEVDERVFCFERSAREAGQRILVLANLCGHTVSVPRDRLPSGLSTRTELLQLTEPQWDPDGLSLEPYAVFWFSRGL